jgi:DNA-binding transcriptional MerR regulator
VLELSARLRRIGEAAEATGLTPRTIRYYEELDLLKPAAHITGGNRRYDDEDIERLNLIKQLREVVGLSLADIQEFLETETERREVKRQYHATSDPERQAALLERFEPTLRRRVHLLEHKLAAVQTMLNEERSRLQRVQALRAELQATR